MTANEYPIVVEQEANGAWSAWVPGLAVYAQDKTRAAVVERLRRALKAHLEMLAVIQRGPAGRG